MVANMIVIFPAETCTQICNSYFVPFEEKKKLLPTTDGDHCMGDGLKMTFAVGGECLALEWVQVYPTSLAHPDEPDAKVKFLAAEAL